MPELPEVETIRRGIEPWVLEQPVAGVVIRQAQLRWMIPADLPGHLVGQSFIAVQRRAKYLLLQNQEGCLLIHLGMSGSLRIVDSGLEPGRHDHVDIVFENGRCLRLNDPRRFGAVLWVGNKPEEHVLLAHLGPEPLSDEFNGALLYVGSRGRKLAVKNYLMDQKTVVGVGNIYASEALYRAGIHPALAAGRVSRRRYGLLAEAVRQVLTQAIAAGGTTLRDFTDEKGRPGYFSQQLQVYGREGLPCAHCGRPITCETIGQRSSYFCGRCQR